MKHFAMAFATVLTLALTPASAQDFQAGFEAYSKGDYTAAIDEWLPLAEAGDVTAQYNLAYMYRFGVGVPEDATEAARRYRLPPEQGDAVSQSNLADMYRNGEGVCRASPRRCAGSGRQQRSTTLMPRITWL